MYNYTELSTEFLEQMKVLFCYDGVTLALSLSSPKRIHHSRPMDVGKAGQGKVYSTCVYMYMYMYIHCIYTPVRAEGTRTCIIYVHVHVARQRHCIS